MFSCLRRILFIYPELNKMKKSSVCSLKVD